MPRVMFPYGHGQLEHEFPEESFLGSLVPPLCSYVAEGTPQELVERAVRTPIGCPPLHILAQGKRHVVILVSDHTRPVPSRLILPVLLAEIRRGAPKAQITILVATGCHRATTGEELRKKLGPELAGQARVLVHDCDGPVIDCGYLPSGGRLLLNKTGGRSAGGGGLHRIALFCRLFGWTEERAARHRRPKNRPVQPQCGFHRTPVRSRREPAGKSCACRHAVCGPGSPAGVHL